MLPNSDEEDCTCRDEDDYVCAPCKIFFAKREEQFYKTPNVIESEYQKNLWGPNGLLWDPNDPICQEVLAEMNGERNE